MATCATKAPRALQLAVLPGILSRNIAGKVILELPGVPSPEGPKGEKGVKGSIGLNGLTEENGLKGSRGTQGVQRQWSFSPLSPMLPLTPFSSGDHGCQALLVEEGLVSQRSQKEREGLKVFLDFLQVCRELRKT